MKDKLNKLDELLQSDNPVNWELALLLASSFLEERDAKNEVFIRMLYSRNTMENDQYTKCIEFIDEHLGGHRYLFIFRNHVSLVGKSYNSAISGGFITSDTSRAGRIIYSSNKSK